MIDWDKPIQTRDGQPARHLGVYSPNEKAYHAIVIGKPGAEQLCVVRSGGQCSDGTEGPLDIINVPPAKLTGTFWVNVYECADGMAYAGSGFDTRADADQCASGCTSPPRIACAECHWVEGDGL